MMGLVFVVEGNIRAGRLAQQSLERPDYIVRLFSTKDVIEEAQDTPPLLMLIAARLPDGSGLDLCRSIRENLILAKTPIILLIDDASEEERVMGLECGADDCLSKPFTSRELVARVQAVLRRTAYPPPVPISEPTEIVIDKAAMRLSVRGNEIATTTLEFRLIDYLARHRGQVFTRDVLLDAVWGEMQFVTPRSVDACVRRVRNKIEPNREQPTYLKTLRGVGYRFDAVAVWPGEVENCKCPACSASIGSSRLAATGTSGRRNSAS
jgi:DNA-binding response OmpR family regulator